MVPLVASILSPLGRPPVVGLVSVVLVTGVCVVDDVEFL